MCKISMSEKRVTIYISLKVFNIRAMICIIYKKQFNRIMLHPLSATPMPASTARNKAKKPPNFRNIFTLQVSISINGSVWTNSNHTGEAGYIGLYIQKGNCTCCHMIQYYDVFIIHLLSQYLTKSRTVKNYSYFVASICVWKNESN